MNETDVETVRKMADQIMPSVSHLKPSIALAALELACARITLANEGADEERAEAAELFESAAAVELEALASADFAAWADSLFADEPIPYDLTLCPSCSQPVTDCQCGRFPL
jgi:uncharacterized membrane-anchored protein